MVLFLYLKLWQKEYSVKLMNNRLVRAKAGQSGPKRAKAMQKCVFNKEVVRKLKFPNNATSLKLG